MVLPPRPDLGSLPPPTPGSVPAPAPGTATWSWWEVLLVYLGSYFVGSIVGVPLYYWLNGRTTVGPAGTAELAVSLVGALVSGGGLIVWMQKKHPGWTRVVGWPAWREVPKELAIGAVLGLLVLFGATVASQVFLAIFRSASGHSVDLPQQVSSHLSVAGAILFAVYAVLVAPAVEELFFRGLLFRSLRRRHSVWIAALGSAIPFGIVHYVGGAWTSAVALQLTMVATGIGLALVHERRGNLLANMASHAAFNAVAVVTILAVVILR